MRHLYFFLFTILFSSFVFAQVSTVQDGKWYWGSTWSTGVMPDSNDNVIVNHTIDLDGGGRCNNLTINSGGRIHNGNLVSYGSVTNNGTIDGTGEWYGMKIFLRGTLTNSGYFDSAIEFNGNSDQSVYSSDTLRLGFCYKKNPSTKLIFEDPLILKGGFLFLQQSNLLLKKNLVLVNSGIDGGLISAGGNEIYGVNTAIGWHGAIGFGPDQTTIENAVLDGYLMFTGYPGDSTVWTTGFSGNTINNGTITTYPHHMGNSAYLKIRGDFTNNGTVKSYSDGTYLEFIEGDLINNGILMNKRITFYNQHTFTNNSSDSLQVEEIYGVDENTKVVVEGNLIFTDQIIPDRYTYGGIINMKKGTMILQANSELTNFGLQVDYGDSTSTIEANNSILTTHYKHKASGTLKDAKINIINASRAVLEGNTEIIENGVFKGFMVNVMGNITNKGTVTSNSSVKVAGNVYNQGLWESTLTLNGTEDQFVKFDTDSSFQSYISLVSNLEGSSYQWKKDGEDLTNATAQNYLIYTVDSDSEGEYICIADGTQQSRTVTIGEGGGTSPEQVVILEQTFDSAENLDGWVVVNNHETHSWAIGNITDHNFDAIDPTSLASAVCPYIAEDQDEYLITPSFSLGDGSASVEFYSGYNSQWLPNAKLILMLVTNDGQDWDQIWEFDATTDGWEWINFSVDLTPYANQSDIQLAFEYVGNDGDYAALDNVVIKGYEYITDIEDDNYNLLPNEFVLNQNYPNPFNPTTTISYQLPTNSLVELKVFDMLGREVSALVNEEQAAGTYSVQFDASNLASGIYIYNINAGNFTKTMKMILLK